MSMWEAKHAEKFDRCLVVSPVEGEMLRTSNPKLDVSLVENGVDTAHCQPLDDNGVSNTLLFVGVMGYPPNVDAISYFCEDIMPLIRERIPRIELIVACQEPAAEILKLGDRKNVVVTGYVDDSTPYYRQSQVTIVPLRGGGTRLKILESMAFGRPVVSTTLGCEGLDVTHEENIMVADTLSQFAECGLRS